MYSEVLQMSPGVSLSLMMIQEMLFSDSGRKGGMGLAGENSDPKEGQWV